MLTIVFVAARTANTKALLMVYHPFHDDTKYSRSLNLNSGYI